MKGFLLSLLFIVFHFQFVVIPIKSQSIPTPFTLPSPLPIWPSGGGFGSRTIDLGGLQVSEISSFNKVWATHEGGPDNLGASFFDPVDIPQDFYMLGCYAQPNNVPLYGWVLVAKDQQPGTLAKPIDYALVWSSESLTIKQDGFGYVWLPIPPLGYNPTGLVVTNSSNKPSVDKIRCVRSDHTDQLQTGSWVWGLPGGFNVFSVDPTNRGTQAMSVGVGTFWAQKGDPVNPIPLSCLQNVNPNNMSFMPNLAQIEAVFQAYSPRIYFHPDEAFFPSSVDWFFSNGALLYTRGNESNPVQVSPDESNLPMGGSDDGAFWLDLPADPNKKDRVKRGDIQSARVYLHVKPMLGATFTDIVIWVFCPFNGAAKAKVGIFNVNLGRIGEHVGDWEHITLRISNFNGALQSVYFSEHSGGTWFSASQLEFQDKTNKFVAYSSFHGHAMYPKEALILRGKGKIGIKSIDTAKSNYVLETGNSYSLMSAEYLGGQVVDAEWVNYMRKWGPKIDYDINGEIKKVKKLLIGKLKSEFEKFIRSLPAEVLGEEGPTGPKAKVSWNGDEV